MLSGGTLVLLALRPPRRLLDRLGRRPILGAAAAGAGIALVLVVVGLPLAAVAHERAVDVGLSTQDWGPWLGDQAKSAALEAVFTAGGAALLLAVVRRFRRNWWAPAAAGVVAVGVASLWLFPVVIDPIFNRFDKLPPGQLRSDVLTLARKAGVDVGEVYRVDASRRTTAANAYVNGIGHTKRVVLYDNLIEDFPEDQVRMVVAHELGHQKHEDIYRGLAWLAIVAPAGTFLAQALAERFGRREGLDDPKRKPAPAALPAIVLSMALCLVRDGKRLERAVPQGRGARRRLRPRADPRPRRPDRARAQAGGQQRLRSRPAAAATRPVRHPPDHGRADRHRGDLGQGELGRRGGALGLVELRQVADPPPASATWRSCPPSRRSARA